MKYLMTILAVIFAYVANAKNYTAKDTIIDGAKYIVISGCNESMTDDHILVSKTSGKVLIDVTHLDLLAKYINGELTDNNEISVLSFSFKPLFSTYTIGNDNSLRKNAWFYNNVIIVRSSKVTHIVMQPSDIVGNISLAVSKEELRKLLADWLKEY